MTSPAERIPYTCATADLSTAISAALTGSTRPSESRILYTESTLAVVEVNEGPELDSSKSARMTITSLVGSSVPAPHLLHY